MPVRSIALALAVLLGAGAAPAEGERAGAFDYYVLTLSWSPSWCAIEGDARGAEQCARPMGWSLHGLWPQNELGWPSWCRGAARDPSRRDTAAMADIMESGGLAWHQWKKHGRCSGLPGSDYLALSRAAYGAVARPALLRRLDARATARARGGGGVHRGQSRPRPRHDHDHLPRRAGDGGAHLPHPDLSFRRCGADVLRDCAQEDALLDPVR